MSTISTAQSKRRPPHPPLLHNGDRMTQPEFHRLYEAYPKEVKAELIGGIVFMPSPLRHLHGSHHPELGGPFWLYKAATPGVEVLDNTTLILGSESEPQPDLALRIMDDFGGQSWVPEDGYVRGAPELVAEVAHSTRNIDLHLKREDYQKAGVLEYVVACLQPEEVHYIDLATNKPIKPNRQGVYRSRVFPGLWIDGQAVLACDSPRIIKVLQQGLASREHAAFVKRLQAAHHKKTREKRKTDLP